MDQDVRRLLEAAIEVGWHSEMEELTVRNAFDAMDEVWARASTKGYASGYAGLSAEGKLAAFREMVASAPKEGSRLCFGLPDDLMYYAVYAGVETGVLGDNPHLCVLYVVDEPEAGMTNYSWVLSDDDVHPAYQMALIARGLYNQVPTMKFENACLLAVTGLVERVSDYLLDPVASEMTTYGFVLRSATTNPSNKRMTEIAGAVRAGLASFQFGGMKAETNMPVVGQRASQRENDKLLALQDSIKKEKGEITHRELFEELAARGAIRPEDYEYAAKRAGVKPHEVLGRDLNKARKRREKSKRKLREKSEKGVEPVEGVDIFEVNPGVTVTLEELRQGIDWETKRAMQKGELMAEDAPKEQGEAGVAE